MSLQSPHDSYLPGQIPPLPFRANNNFLHTLVAGIFVLGLFACISYAIFYFKMTRVYKADSGLSPQIQAWIVFIFGAVFVLCFLFKQYKSAFMFELTKQGIRYDTDFPIMPWQDIVEAKTLKNSNGVFVGIFLEDNKRYLSQVSSIRKPLIEEDIQKYGTSIYLIPTAIHISNDDLINWINHYKNLYGTKS